MASTAFAGGGKFDSQKISENEYAALSHGTMMSRSVRDLSQEGSSFAVEELSKSLSEIPDIYEDLNKSLTASELLRSYRFMDISNQEHSNQAQISQKLVGGFTISELQKMGNYANISYVNPDDPKSNHMQSIKDMMSHGDKVTIFGTSRENSGIIIEKIDGEVIVAYHGTKSLANVGTDIWANRALSREMIGGFHNGFYNGFKQTKDQVLERLNLIALHQGKPLNDLRVRVTGHSMGAGLAGICAKWLDEVHGIGDLKAALFASPVFLDSVGAKDYQNRNIGKNTAVIAEDWVDPIPMADGNQALMIAAPLGAAIMGTQLLPTAIALYPFMFYGEHIGETLSLPKLSEDTVHKMGGYNKALAALEQAMAQNDAGIKVGDRAYGFEPNQDRGISKTPLIFGSVPNPLHGLAKVREALHENVVYPTHKAFKEVKDTIIDSVSAAKEAFQEKIAPTQKAFSEAKDAIADSVSAGAKTFVSSVKSAAKKFWGYFSG